MKLHPEEKHCLPATDRTELHRGMGSWRLKLAQHPRERGGLGSDATDCFDIYWAMPEATGAAVRQNSARWSSLECTWQVVRKVLRVGRNVHFSRKVGRILKKKSFAKMTVCGWLFAEKRVILMYFLITKVAGRGNEQEFLIYPCRMPWLGVGWSCKDLQGSCLVSALSLLVLTQLCPPWLCCSQGTVTWPMARAVGKLWLIHGCKALLGLGTKGTTGTWSTRKEHNDVMFMYRRT